MPNNYLQFSFTVLIDDADCRKWVDDYLDAERLGFSYEWSGTTLLIFADESGDTEDVAHFLQTLLLQPGFGLQQVGFTYAYTCSKMRPGEFGGGAVRVFRETKGTGANHIKETRVTYIDTGEWLSKEMG